MSRFAKITTLDEFKKIINEKLLNEGFPHELPSKIEKDLSKVNFDWENYNLGEADPNYKEEYASDYEGFCEYPCGYDVLDNGLPVLFINAGGDWEMPICICIYWDGKYLRGYIPEDGNLWNKKEKCAFGSEEEQPEEEFDEDLVGDAELIKADIMERIKIK